MRFGRMLLVVLAACSSTFAAAITYQAVLTGPGEAPPNTSPGTGLADVTVDTVTNLMTVQVVFSGLEADTTASHIHCCVAPPGTAPVATTLPTFPGFPLGVTMGTYNQTFDLTLASSYNPAFVSSHGGTPTSAEAALLAGLAGDMAYLNIHTTLFPGGEISGFLVPVPEPGSLVLAGIGLAFCARRLRAVS